MNLEADIEGNLHMSLEDDLEGKLLTSGVMTSRINLVELTPYEYIHINTHVEYYLEPNP